MGDAAARAARTPVSAAARDGPYILDFYCPAAKLCVEVDGPSHEEREEHDARRTAWLAEQGVRVVRFTVADVEQRSAWVVAEIGRLGAS